VAYTEWLRARGALKWTIVVLAILLGIALVMYLFRTQLIISGSGVHAEQEMTAGHFVSAGVLIALIVATVLGAPFAKENDGHLEIALTKPIDRVALAAQIMGIDAVAVVVAFVLGFAFSAIVHMLFLPGSYAFTGTDFMAIVLSIAGCVAWYAMLNAATASMKRGYGAVSGLAWPIALGVIGGTHLPPGEPIRDAIRTLCTVVDYLNPLHYVLGTNLSFTELVTLLVLALVYATLAAIQWRRVEA
jgi:hypothetical protein